MPKAAGKDKEMDGVEKAAILLIALGPEKSAQIFKHLKEDEIEQLTLEIANTSSVSPQTKEMVLLVNSLMMRDVTTDEDLGAESFTEIEMSALNEIGNIVSGSYLNALSSLTNLKMICTVPSLTVDMVGALLSVPAAEFGKYGDKLLMIQSEFGEMDFVTGYFLLIPELDSYDKILASLGM